MAFQDFRIAKPEGPDALIGGMNSLTNAFVEAQKIKRDKDQRALENLRQSNQDKRQAQLDYQNTLLKAQELAAPGPHQDLAAAQALMAPYGAQQGQRELPDDPRALGGQPPPSLGVPAAPAGPMPAAAAPPPAPAFEGDQGEEEQQPQAAAPAPVEPPPFNPDAALPMAAQAPAQEPAHPLVAAAQADRAQKKRMATFLFGAGPDGQRWTLDPEAQRAAQKAAAEEERTARVGQLGQAGLEDKYQKFGQTMLAMGVEPVKVGSVLSAMIEKDHAVDSTSDNVDKRITATGKNVDKRIASAMDIEKQKELGRSNLESQQQAGGKYKRGGHGSGAADGGEGYDPKVEKNNIAALNSYKARADHWFRSSGMQEMQKAHEEADRALTSLKTGNPAGAAHALEKFVAISRNGMATTSALKLFQEHLAGLGGSIEGVLAQAENGTLGPEKTKNLGNAIQTVMQSLEGQIGAKHEQFVKSNYTPALYQMKGNVEDKEEEFFGALGYHPRYDEKAPTIVPGTGRHPSASGRGSEPAAGAAPPMTPEDAAMVTIARQRLQKNPNDAKAKQVLQLHKLAQ